MELHFIGHVNEKPMITVDAQWHKTDENGNMILNEDKTAILTEGINLPYKIHLHCKNRGNHKYTLFRQIREVLRQVQTPKTEDKDLLPVFCS